MSESSDSEEEKRNTDHRLEEQIQREQQLRELRKRIDREEQHKIEILRREAEEWERQQRINPVPNPLLMPVEPENLYGEQSLDEHVHSNTE